MNHSDPQLNPQRLVEDYFLRELSEQELAELNVALAMNPELKAQFMKSMYDDLDLYEAVENMEKEQVLRDSAVFYAKRKSSRIARMNRMNRIAASLVFLVGIGVVVYRAMNRSPEVTESPVEPIVPTLPEALPVETLAENEYQPEEQVVEEMVEEFAPPPALPEIEDEMRMVARVKKLFVLDGGRVHAKNSDEIRQLHAGDLLAVGDALSVPAGGRLTIEY